MRKRVDLIENYKEVAQFLCHIVKVGAENDDSQCLIVWK